MEHILKLGYSLIEAIGPHTSFLLVIRDINDEYMVEHVPGGMILSTESESFWGDKLLNFKQLHNLLQDVYFICINGMNRNENTDIILYQGIPGRQNKRKNDRESEDNSKRQAIDDLNLDRMNLFGQANTNPKDIIKIVTQLIDSVPGLILDIYTDPEDGSIYFIEKKNDQIYISDEGGELEDKPIHSMEEMYNLIKGPVVILTIVQKLSSKIVRSLTLYNVLTGTSFGKSGGLKKKVRTISNEIKYLSR